MVVDKLLRDIQLKLIELTNEIQRQREFRLKARGYKKEKKEYELQKTCDKLAIVFKELGYEKTN